MQRISILLLTLGGLVLSGLFLICYGLQTRKEAPVPLAREIHIQLHAVAESPLLSKEDLEAPIEGLDFLSHSLSKMENRVASCLPPAESHPRELLLEESILRRLRELIHYRISCERSLHSALHDPLTENPLAGAVEITATLPTAPKDGGVASSEETQLRRHIAELRRDNQQRVSDDTRRRRKIFADGARTRWVEARRRISLQVRHDLQTLDRLMGASFL
jgi:hypothetical protein